MRDAKRVFVAHPIQDADDQQMTSKADAIVDEVIAALRAVTQSLLRLNERAAWEVPIAETDLLRLLHSRRGVRRAICCDWYIQLRPRGLYGAHVGRVRVD